MSENLQKLANAVPGERSTINSAGGTISFYRAAGDEANALPPLLLLIIAILIIVIMSPAVLPVEKVTLLVLSVYSLGFNNNPFSKTKQFPVI